MPELIHNKWVYGQRTNITKAATDKREHAGLWFDKYISRQQKKDIPLGKEELSPYKVLVDTVADIPEPPMYSQFFKRWQQQLETMRVAIDECEYKVQYQYATAQGRIAIGLGDESVIETAMTLHHTYGVPYIPGSALKGLASAYAHRFLEDEGWRKKGEYHTAMFGTTDSSGYITFFDALYRPGTGHKNKKGIAQALWPDVITVHHKAYYENQKNKAPADWDNPTPIPFLTATGTYLVALGGPDSWVSLAFNLLGKALAEMGIGAKTNSGYGRMNLTKEWTPAAEEPNLHTPAVTTQQSTPVEPQDSSTLLTIGRLITGQRAGQTERFDFKDRRIKGVRITPNKNQITPPQQRELVIFTDDQQKSGGFRGEIIDIDDSNHRELRILVKAIRKTK